MTSRAERRHPEIEQPCSWCHAIPGEPCTNRRNERREKPHPGRRDVWVIAHTDCPTCQAQAGTPCPIQTPGSQQVGVHLGRAQAATAAYEQALEDASHDMNTRRSR
ncbi:hypothetical protein ACFUEN_29230 [Streptomyces griseorubiginosus]|uniref:zinc finger domain-containing protein n=1 Tax=Streptomyces griseorubiginosus TaxID=67304 RepID=UPI0036318BE2